MYNNFTSDVAKFVSDLENRRLTVEQIAQSPLILEADKRASKYETCYIHTQERQKLRNEIKMQLINSGSSDASGNVFSGEVKSERRVDIVIGLPASGKSTVISNPLSYEHKSKIIDSDMAKEMLPEYDNGFGAGAVHRESQAIIKDVLAEAVKKGNNIVIPIVGSKIDQLEEMISDFKENNYRVNLHLNEVSTEEAVRRCAIRFAYTGRYVPIDRVLTYGDKPSKVYEQAKHLVDGYSRYDNNGTAKVEIEKYEKPLAKEERKQNWWESNLDSNKKYPLMRDEVITKKRKDGKAICLFLPVEGAEKGKCADFWVATSQVSIEPKDGKAYVAAITKVGAKDSSYLRKSVSIAVSKANQKNSEVDNENVME